MSIEKRYISVKSRVNNNAVKLLAVSKKQPISKIRQLYQLGHCTFGESYVQEAIEKIELLRDLAIQWHFIGPIQSNKTKYLAKYFDWVQSVSTLKILSRLNKQRDPSREKLNVLLQLKVGNEKSKKGFDTNELLAICQKQEDFENTRIRGLMSIPKPSDDYNVQLDQFSHCKDVFEQMKAYVAVDTLSIGMSSDLEAAIKSGSTMVRVGTDIFGKRE
jgi:pyridoxal phosphate enzyme (YggS family)